METLYVIMDQNRDTMAVGDNYQNALADAMENMGLKSTGEVEYLLFEGILKMETSTIETGGYDGIDEDCWLSELMVEKTPYVDYERG